MTEDEMIGWHHQLNGYELKQTLGDSGTSGKEPTCHCGQIPETRVLSLGREDPLEEDMATHSNILSWRNTWTEDPGRLQSRVAESDTTEVTQHAHAHACTLIVVKALFHA